MKQPGLLLLLLFQFLFPLSLSLQISFFPVFLRLSWRLSEQTNTQGSTASQTAWCGIVCFGCSRAGESFLKRHTEVRSSTERPQNKYLPSSAWALSSPPWTRNKRMDLLSVLKTERDVVHMQRLDSQFVNYDWLSRLLIDTVNAEHGVIVQSYSQSYTLAVTHMIS